MSTVIVDYGSGNLRSAQKAFERMAAERGVRTDIAVSGDPDAVASAERIVLPGVGAFGDCRHGLDTIDGMVEALEEAVHGAQKPFFGICVGMQLMATRGLEHGVHQGFGWIQGDVVAIAPDDPALKVPHMGWNRLNIVRDHPVFRDLPADYAYFVHSFHLAAGHGEDVIATCDYGGTLTAAVGRGTMIGTQFHPEKSQALGLALIGNFLEWRP